MSHKFDFDIILDEIMVNDKYMLKGEGEGNEYGAFKA